MLYSQRAAETIFLSQLFLHNDTRYIGTDLPHLHKINVNDPRCDIRYPVGDDIQLQKCSMQKYQK